MGATGPRYSNFIGAGEGGGGQQDDRVQVRPEEGGESRANMKKPSHLCVGTSTVVWGKGEGGGGQTNGDDKIQNHQHRNPRSLRGSPSTTSTPPPPHPPLPIPTSRTGRAGLSLKRQDIGQAVRGGQPSIGLKSVGQKAAGWAVSEGSMLLMVYGNLNAERSRRGGLRSRRECTHGQGRVGGPNQTIRRGGRRKALTSRAETTWRFSVPAA